MYVRILSCCCVITIFLIYVVRLQSSAISAKKTDQHRKTAHQRLVVSPPEIAHLTNEFVKFKETGEWKCLIAIGDIYRHGAYPRFLPREDMASDCYKICARCPDADIAGIAQIKFIESIVDKLSDDDKRGDNLPLEYGEMACALAETRISLMPYSLFQRPRNTIKHQTNLPEINIPEINIPVRREHVNEYVGLPGRQNVHDHAVINIAKANLEVMEIVEPVCFTDIRNEVERSISKVQNLEMSVQQKADALLILNTLGDSEHSRFGLSEKEVLATVWNKISREKDNDLQSNLKHTLCKQLADSVENGSTVCSTGKCVRMLATFDGTDVANEGGVRSFVPLHILKDEIATLASEVRGKFTTDMDVEQQTQYQLGLFDMAMKQEFRNACETEYYTKLKMSEAILEPIITMFEDAF